MKRIKGTNRIVFLFPNFVVKFPRIYFLSAFRSFYRTSKDNLKFIFKFGLKKYFENNREFKKEREEMYKRAEMISGEKIEKCKFYESRGSYSFKFLAGIVANLREFIFYQKNFYQKNKNLRLFSPTYFSFFGLFNIQKRGTELDLEGFALWHIMSHVQEKGNKQEIMYSDCHTLQNNDNFCLINKSIKVVDYGSRKALYFLEKYAIPISKKFDEFCKEKGLK